MKGLLWFRRNNFFSRLLIAFVLVVILTTITLSSVLYINFENISVKLLADSTAERLRHVGYSFGFMQKTAKMLSIQVYYDTVIRDLFLKNPEPTSISRAVIRLSSYVNSSPYVDSIYVYSLDNDTFYSSVSTSMPLKGRDFFDQEIINTLYSGLGSQAITMLPRKTPGGAPGIQSSHWYTFLFRESSIYSKPVTDTVIVNFAENWMKDSIGEIDDSLQSMDFFMDRNGNLLVNTATAALGDNVAGQPYAQRILQSGQPQGYFVAEYEGVKSLITYISTASDGNYFVSILPYDRIIGQISAMKNLTLLVCLAILTAGLVASALLSRGLYKPYDAMSSKLSKLEVERRRDQGMRGNDLLRQILSSGAAQEDIARLRQEFAELGLSVNPAERMSLVLARIEGYRQIRTRFSSHDRRLIKFGIVTIIRDKLAASLSCTVVDMGGDCIAAIFNLPPGTVSVKELRLNEVLADIQRSVVEHAGRELTFAIGHIADDITSADRAYQNAFMLSRYRIFYPAGAILTADILDPRLDCRYSYPASREKKILEYLMLGNADDAAAEVRTLLLEASCYLFSGFEMSVNRLLAAVGSAIDTLERNGDIDLGSVLAKLHVDFDEIASIDAIADHFRGIFMEIAVRMNEKREDRPNDIVNRIMDYASLHYADKNLSINSIADILGMSPGYLGRLFRKATEKSVADYINELRLARAQEMLKSTNLPINEIADRIGVENSKYFFTLFKKQYGCTPNEYRQGSRLAEQ